MPEVKAVKVLSFSNEDREYPASNLLKVNAFSKWKCQQATDKNAVVTFSFGEPLQFNRIDVGNEASAFVQIEVSRSASSSNFEVLLPASSFMSPDDAKKSVSLNRVRIFSGSELTPSVASQKWDIVRVTCTQPFNKALQYGLSFIRFYSVSATNDATIADEGSSSQESESSEALKPGSLFKLAKEQSKDLSNLNTSNLTSKPVVPPTTMASQPSQPSVAVPDDPAAGPSGSISEASSSRVNDANRKILSGVVVAFSGYKNPFRAELRDLCLQLGAKYRQDWTDDCTHLVCAFPNTPKWLSVKGNGVITSHKWIQACHDAQRRVSWRRYRVGRAPSPVGYVSDTKADSEGSGSDWERSLIADDASDDWRPGNGDDDDDDDAETSESDASAEEDDDESEGSLGAPKRPKKSNALREAKTVKRRRRLENHRTHPDPDGEDTDEEIQRHLNTASGSGRSNSTESAPNASKSLPRDLPEILNGKKFYIFSKNFDSKEEEVVYRLIITFGGKVESYMTADVDYVISRASWCDDFDDALNVAPSLIFVRPEWIYACDKTGKLVPFQRYQVVG